MSRRAARRLHPWVFSNEVRRVEGKPGPGDVVRVFDKGGYVGNAIYSPHSLMRARLYSVEDRELDTALLTARISAAFELRRHALPAEQDYRLVFGESDGLPGLTIDKYGNHFVLQAYAAGIEQRLEQIATALRSRFTVESVFLKNDISLRELEGLERYERLMFGNLPDRVTVTENRAVFRADIRTGQKTGFYFDQRLNRARIRDLSAGKAVLDVFSYTGACSINAALGGAAGVLAIDSSAPACELVKEIGRAHV